MAVAQAPRNDLQAIVSAINEAREIHENNGLQARCLDIFERFQALTLSDHLARAFDMAALRHLNPIFERAGANFRVRVRNFDQNQFLARPMQRLSLNAHGEFVIDEVEPEMPIRRIVREPFFSIELIPVVLTVVAAVISFFTLGVGYSILLGALTYFTASHNLDKIHDFLFVETVASEWTHELYLEQIDPRHSVAAPVAAPVEELDQEEDVCPISQVAVSDIPDEFLIEHPRTKKIFDYRYFFYFIISSNKIFDRNLERYIHFDPLTRQEISPDFLQSLLERFGFTTQKLNSHWGNEEDEKNVAIQEMARRRGVNPLDEESQIQFFQSPDMSVLVSAKVIEDRVVRILRDVLDNAYVDEQHNYTHQVQSLMGLNLIPRSVKTRLESFGYHFS